MTRHEITHHPNYEVASFKEYHNNLLVREENYNNKGERHGLFSYWGVEFNTRVEAVYENSVRISYRLWFSSGDEIMDSATKRLFALTLGLM